MRFKAIAAQVLWPIDRTLALTAYLGVASYRRWLSPWKGFACAHGVLTREPSCSEVAARALLTTTFSKSIPVITNQFECCRRSYGAYRNDLIGAANNHLLQFGSLAGVSALGCCGSPVPGPDGPMPIVSDETRVFADVGQFPSAGEDTAPTDGDNRPPADQSAQS
jgi:putative component of membrane protein insertase Oxa1/YidC/SpoIIIJ protein YidD